MLVTANSLLAQTSSSRRWDETKEDWYRRMINFDYSLADYNVNRPDSNIVGWRTAKILLTLENNYDQALYNRLLSQIRNEQMGENELIYLPIDIIKVTNVQKTDSVITIKINTSSKLEKKKTIDFEMIFTFENSLSSDETTNQLFSEIGRYIMPEE